MILMNDFKAEPAALKEEMLAAVARVIDMTNIGTVAHQRIDTLSKGYKRRVGLAHALVHDPQVLILDEPTDGLDPNQKHEVRSLITEMAPGKAIIISTSWRKSTRCVRVH